MDLYEHVHKPIEKHRSKGLNVPPIKVAIIDTGVNFENWAIQEAIEGGNIQGKYCKGFPKDEHHDPTADKNGHGTYVASVLLRTAPNVSLYIARAFNDAGRPCDQDDYKELTNVHALKSFSLRCLGDYVGH